MKKIEPIQTSKTQSIWKHFTFKRRGEGKARGKGASRVACPVCGESAE